MHILEPDQIAFQTRAAIKREIAENNYLITIAGFLVAGDRASEIYAHYTQVGCEDVGIRFRLIATDSSCIQKQLAAANLDPNIHGIFLYYPIFGDHRDIELRNTVSWRKDVEGLTAYWLKKLYDNVRFEDDIRTRKAILPCTPLAIIKLLETTVFYKDDALPFDGCTISIFNRSEIVGKPLAYMLANDGGTVYSFDINGGIIINPTTGVNLQTIERKQALQNSNIVITGVPTQNFTKIRAEELRDSSVCINFSYIQNFTTAAQNKARCFIPKIGQLTVAMCLRNALRLYRHYWSTS
ncbi:methylenetetrahydrofolate dehydrogenase [Achromatium sp. WMS1]|nr:methylenetetrahydrofolate dehydrogenase [Achromatium sp. WMS1]